MKCPNDGDTMLVTVRMGIEIDFCPTCRGIWMDRGELSKLFEREAAAYGGPARLPAEPGDPEAAPQPLAPPETSVPVTSIPRTRQAPDEGPWGGGDFDEDDDDDDDDRSRRKRDRRRRRYDDRDWHRRHTREQIVDSFLKDFFDL